MQDKVYVNTGTWSRTSDNEWRIKVRFNALGRKHPSRGKGKGTEHDIMLWTRGKPKPAKVKVRLVTNVLSAVLPYAYAEIVDRD